MQRREQASNGWGSRFRIVFKLQIHGSLGCDCGGVDNRNLAGRM
jgi:hypothetical protein